MVELKADMLLKARYDLMKNALHSKDCLRVERAVAFVQTDVHNPCHTLNAQHL